MNITLFEMIQATIRYSVAAGALLMTAHVGLLLIGYNEPVADWCIGLSVFGFVILLMTSFCLRLCNLFRAFLTYIFTVSQCIRLQREFSLFDGILQESRLAVFALGVMLLTYFVIRIKYYTRCSTRR